MLPKNIFCNIISLLSQNIPVMTDSKTVANIHQALLPPVHTFDYLSMNFVQGHIMYNGYSKEVP